jgi:hypothetical protein
VAATRTRSKTDLHVYVVNIENEKYIREEIQIRNFGSFSMGVKFGFYFDRGTQAESV